MKIYKTQKEVDADIKDNTLTIKGDVIFEFSLKMEARLVVEGGNIKAWDIEAWNIKAWDIEAGNIKAGDIEAENIKAGDIEAENIKAWNIEAGNISFYAVAFVYISFKCKSIIGRRENAKYFCLDSEVVISNE